MSRLNTHTRKVEVEPLKDLNWRLHCFQICKKIRKGGCVFFQFVQTRVTGTCGRFYQERRFFSNLCENFALFLNKIAWVQDKRIVSKKIFGKLALPAETFWKAFLSAKAAQPILQKILNWCAHFELNCMILFFWSSGSFLRLGDCIEERSVGRWKRREYKRREIRLNKAESRILLG